MPDRERLQRSSKAHSPPAVMNVMPAGEGQRGLSVQLRAVTRPRPIEGILMGEAARTWRCLARGKLGREPCKFHCTSYFQKHFHIHRIVPEHCERKTNYYH